MIGTEKITPIKKKKLQEPDIAVHHFSKVAESKVGQETRMYCQGTEASSYYVSEDL